MVPLPLFKLGALFLRHISKYGANRIKKQAHDHIKFRVFAARYGQMMHQLNMRMSVALLRDAEAERRAKEKAEAPTVKTEQQTKREEEAKEKEKVRERRSLEGKGSSPSPSPSLSSSLSSSSLSSSSSTSSSSSPCSSKQKQRPFQNIWTRKFRPLPEEKAVDLFADVVGDGFILSVAVCLILYETWRSGKKPDANKERIEALAKRLDAREEELRLAEEQQAERLEMLELALRQLQEVKRKSAPTPSLQEARPTG